jgi:hypothetical protein
MYLHILLGVIIVMPDCHHPRNLSSTQLWNMLQVTFNVLNAYLDVSQEIS